MSGSGRYDMNRPKDAMLLIANDGPLVVPSGSTTRCVVTGRDIENAISVVIFTGLPVP